jgi:glycosyltransferase involved in cell wall biosynthesis
MSIYVDVSAAVHHRAGLGRYGDSLVRELSGMMPDRLALFYNREQGVEPLSGLEHLPSRTVSLGYKPWRMAVWMGQLARLPFNRLVPGASLFHATEHLLMPLWGVPTVLTIHDLIPQLLPEHHKPLNRWYLNLTMPLYCRRADHIIAVSEATRRDLLATYHLPPEKVTVIHEAASPRFRPQTESAHERVRRTYGLPKEYLLYVGTIEPRKNLERLLEAWTPLRRSGDYPPLVIVGRRGWLSDSFYAACGTPVVCADASSMPEVVGDAALLFDPLDSDAMKVAMRQIVSDADLRVELRKRGLVRSSKFSWSRAAAETLTVYTQLLAFRSE